MKGREYKERQPVGRGDYEGRSRSRGYDDDRGAGGHGRGGRGGDGSQKGPQVSNFAPGQTNVMQSNHFLLRLRGQNTLIHIYKVDFGPFGTFLPDRRNAMMKIKEDLKQTFGMEELTICSEIRGEQTELKISHYGSCSLDKDSQDKNLQSKVLDFVMKVIKTTLLEKDYKQVGRLPRFFNAKETKTIQQYDLMVWSGYDCSIKCLNDGIFLNIDTATKFVGVTTILDKVNDLSDKKYSKEDIENLFVPKNQNEKRLVVITTYNSKVYQVDGITWDLSPKSYVFEWDSIDKKTKTRKKVKTNMVEYFKLKYNMSIQSKEENQPLLFVNVRDYVIYLPCSLCHEASLPKKFASDSRKMRDLQQYKISNPGERFERINKLISILDTTDTFQEWNIKVNQNFTDVKTKQLYHAQVLDNKGNTRDWSDYETKKIPHSQPVYLKKDSWALIYHQYDFDMANELLRMMQQAQGVFGIRVEEPQWVQLKHQEPKDYINAIKSDIDPKKVTFVCVIIKKRTDKAAIKKFIDSGSVPSQFILADTLKRAKIGVYSNILKQINAKLRQDVYRINIPTLKRSMVVGIDVINEGSQRLIGCCASYNLALTQYYSRLYKQENPKDKNKMSKDEQEWKTTERRCEILTQFFADALKYFQSQNNGNLPEQIFVYRDGVGGPTLRSKVEEYEIKKMVDYFENFTQGYRPKLMYCLVDRNISHRIFVKINGDVLNPGPGTVLDMSLVENQGDKIFDFFLIPHKATVATAQPVHYIVVYNTTSLDKNQIQTTTYHLCYNYFNFQGSIKVPSACMYAHKIAFYSHENNVNPSVHLSPYLHFL